MGVIDFCAGVENTCGKLVESMLKLLGKQRRIFWYLMWKKSATVKKVKKTASYLIK
jgi:hypothetical protein